MVLVGNDPASEVYVRSKHTQTQEAGMASFEHVLPETVAQADLLALITQLNRDPAVHGILVQLPLPKSLHTETIINAIDPAKDVDGLHPSNAGRLAGGFAALSPCTPLGCIILTKSVHASLEGLNAIVIGRSNLVGRPLVQLLLNENATVTIAHSRSRDLPKLCAHADLAWASLRRASPSRAGSPSTAICFSREVAPDSSFTLALGTPSDFANSTRTALLASPPSAIARTRTLSTLRPSANCSIPSMSSRPPRGVTRSAMLIPAAE